MLSDTNKPTKYFNFDSRSTNVNLTTANDDTILSTNNELRNGGLLISKCDHINLFEGRNNFCKECGILVIPNIETYRESIFEHKTGVDANLEQSLMIKKQTNNRLFNPESQTLKYREKLINYIRSKSTEYNFNCLTAYCSISYMDAVLSKFDMKTSYIKT